MSLAWAKARNSHPLCLVLLHSQSSQGLPACLRGRLAREGSRSMRRGEGMLRKSGQHPSSVIIQTVQYADPRCLTVPSPQVRPLQGAGPHLREGCRCLQERAQLHCRQRRRQHPPRHRLSVRERMLSLSHWCPSALASWHASQPCVQAASLSNRVHETQKRAPGVSVSRLRWVRSFGESRCSLRAAADVHDRTI